ncbi:hypothetical protein TRFO_36966 [Tritrichomonas foetus]|uniref:Uncharacterized protein n=1 Tax=Tritrichomonas foetus TaxID=1144522 RepID=A0A1J4JHR6_9EUKA|nr:hypothetical protein TRFO_36966 [Tritrichomonas foetus]|eukprot:OHS96780.1 hypothetical protein TRFO_36966 [Tritrichomonas foetus]
MSERRHNQPRGSRKKIDPLYFAMYRPDDEDPRYIEEIFKQLDDRMHKAAGENTETIATQVFKENATPNSVPIDVWFDLENENDVNDDKDIDATFIPGAFEEGDDFVSRRSFMGSTKKRFSNKPKTGLIGATQQIEHLGAGVDLWPYYKCQQLDVPPMMNVIHDYPNRETFNSRNKIQEIIRNNPINLVDRITAKVIHQIVGEHCDAIIMDPPFGYNDWTKERFQNLLLNLNRYLQRTFIVVWADPENLETIQEVFEKSEYVFCDSIAIELLDPTGGPHFMPADSYGFRRESRMAVMFRTDDINRSDLKQQRVKDTGFGTIYENGKSYGRVGLPNSIHEILEIMLPDLPNRKRTFVELWPSYFTRRDGWINIDEKVNSIEELKDELMPQINASGLDTVYFDDALIDKIIDMDDGSYKRDKKKGDKYGNYSKNDHKNSHGSGIKPIIIRNGMDDRDEYIDVNEIVKRKESRPYMGEFVNDEIIYSSDASSESE